MGDNVIPIRKRRILISDGVIEESEDPADEIGKWMIFVDIGDGVNDDDAVWQGDSHAEARRVAEELSAKHGGLPILDEVAE
jgi:hypothetical protein